MNLDSKDWLIRLRGEEEVHALKICARVAAEQTKFQMIEIVETARFGRALVLDGMYQSSEFDEALKHEALVHPVMALSRGRCAEVLVVGGGEGCVVRELLRYSSVTRVTMVEIDQRVPQLCQKHLGWDGGALQDARTILRIGDAGELVPAMVKEGRRFDVIVVDTTQPLAGSIAGATATPAFFRALREIIAPGGLVAGFGVNAAPVAQYLRSRLRRDAIEAMGGALFEYVVPCPFYSASFAFVVWSADASPEEMKGAIVSRFAKSRPALLHALDVESLVSYLHVPWGYRLAL